MAARKQKHMAMSWYRALRGRPRLVASIAVGVAAWFFLPIDDIVTRALVAWNLCAWLFIILVLKMIAGAEIHEIRRRSGIEEEGRAALLALVGTAAIATLIALGFELFSAKAMQGLARNLRLLLTLSTIFGSWLFVHFVFALYYAHEYHAMKAARSARGGLVFPGEPVPDYWDFIYFSLVVGTTAQTSDVAVTSRLMRRAVAAHGLLSFIYNTAVIAFTVNLAAQFF
jgi:uncharacterized membrane protein